jgi:hypothetical protein
MMEYMEMQRLPVDYNSYGSLHLALIKYFRIILDTFLELHHVTLGFILLRSSTSMV